MLNGILTQHATSPCIIDAHSRFIFRVLSTRLARLRCLRHYKLVRIVFDAISLLLIPMQGPSMFGRELVEQVRADSKDEDRLVPVIVEKCIDAVDTLGK